MRAAADASSAGASRPRCKARAGLAALALASLVQVPAASAEDAAAWLARAATAARQLNYLGTVVYQRGGRIESSRLVHWNDTGREFEKLVSLEGPPREVIRSNGEARCYYPDAKVVRIEPQTFRNAFPSLSVPQQKALAEFYDLRRAETDRVAGLEAQAWVFEPKDGLRYGHKFWADVATGLVLKAHIFDERGVPVEQFSFTDVTIGAKIDADMVRPSWTAAPPEWRVRDAGVREGDARDTGWVANRIPPGFSKIVEGYRDLRGKRAPVAHLVYSDSLVAVSVFVEPAGGTVHPTGLLQQGGVNVYVRQFDDHVVTVLGEAPAVTLRQIAQSVARR